MAPVLSRALPVVAAYGAAALIVLGCVFLLKRHAPGPELAGVLSYFFIASLASGLEPATAKAALLAHGGALPREAEGPILAASALKALAASPFLAILWRFTTPSLPSACLWLTPLIALAGFSTTDLRVALDARRAHAAAIGLKQGSLTGGLAIATALALAHAPLFACLAVSAAARLFFSGFGAGARAALAALAHPRTEIVPLLADVRWLELMGASVVSAAGGSIDRVLALRYLAPGVFASYLLLYEAVTKFWVLPYVLNPILFARMAARQDGGRFVRRSLLLIGAAGAGMLAVIAAALALAPGPLGRLLGPAPAWAALAFAAGIALSAVAQTWNAWLQGSGGTRRAGLLIAANTLASGAVMFALMKSLGLAGLLAGWLVKSIIELTLLALFGRPARAMA